MGLNILLVIEKNSWIDFHIAESLVQMGHQVKKFYYGDSVCEYYETAKYEQRLKKNQALLRYAKELLWYGGLDLIFCYVYDDFLLPKFARELEKLDVPMVNYNVDMACQWYRQINTAKYFSHILCAQPNHMQAMARYAKKVFYFPMAARDFSGGNSAFIPGSSVTFLGTPSVYRYQVLAQLLLDAIPIKIYGKFWSEDKVAETAVSYGLEKIAKDVWRYGWARLRAEGPSSFMNSLLRRLPQQKTLVSIVDHHLGGVLSAEDLHALFALSKINIGFTQILGGNNFLKNHCQMRLRDFEVPFCGGFYLVEKSPGYDQCFVEDKEVVVWSTVPELKEKICYYLAHEQERKKIAEAGCRRAQADHSWANRFQSLFLELGLKTL